MVTHVGSGSLFTPDGTPPEMVRMFLEHGHAPRERMWAELVSSDRVRLLNISRFCDASIGDVFEVEKFCGCEYADGMPHYRAVRQVARGSRRVQAFTRGASPKRAARVLDYLETWPTENGETYIRPAPGMLTPGTCPCCGKPVGVVAHGMQDDETVDYHWVLAFSLDADEDRIRKFLDRLPFLAFHELMPDDGEDE